MRWLRRPLIGSAQRIFGGTKSAACVNFNEPWFRGDDGNEGFGALSRPEKGLPFGNPELQQPFSGGEGKMSDTIQRRPRYSEAFKRHVVAEYEQGATVTELMRRYNIHSHGTIKRWVERYGKKPYRIQTVFIARPKTWTTCANSRSASRPSSTWLRNSPSRTACCGLPWRRPGWPQKNRPPRHGPAGPPGPPRPRPPRLPMARHEPAGVLSGPLPDPTPASPGGDGAGLVPNRPSPPSPHGGTQNLHPCASR
ncbi:MAG: transposase [Chloroflexi bacterium]|nr:transposase [Chloroflexota bacterium]